MHHLFLCLLFWLSAVISDWFFYSNSIELLKSDLLQYDVLLIYSSVHCVNSDVN